jgi:acetyl-CoA acetyltransferase family protein
MSALDAGYDVRASGVTLDRFCGSGITSVNMVAASVMAGMEDLVIAGGCEMMSMEGRRGQGPMMMDSGNLRLRAKHPQSHQGVCADAIATMEGITRQDVDAFGLESQRRAARAIANGYFDRSLVPVYHEDGSLALGRDEYPRPKTTIESLAGLKPAFPAVADTPVDDKGTTYRGLILQRYPDLEIEFVHHAGNSSGVVDGAAAILLASPAYAEAHGLEPRARVVAIANMGDSPTLMLNAPVPATRKVLAKAGLTIDGIETTAKHEHGATAVAAGAPLSYPTAAPERGLGGHRLLAGELFVSRANYPNVSPTCPPAGDRVRKRRRPPSFDLGCVIVGVTRAPRPRRVIGPANFLEACRATPILYGDRRQLLCPISQKGL